MAQRKPKQRLWVELEVIAYKFGVSEYAYAIFNPRTNKEIEMGPSLYKTEKKAVEAGVSYLRATYNTGRPQKGK